jgi:lambda family phage portal protein
VLRLTADVVQHVYDPTRPGQLRGIPYLTRILIRLFGMDKMDDATLLRQQLANMFVAFLSRPSNTGDVEATNPLTGLARDVDATDKEMLSLEPGIFQELGPGEDVKFSDPPDVSPAYSDFMRQQLYHISASTGVPYEILTGDLSRVNDRTVRVILSEFRRRVMMYQHQIVAFQMCKPLWYAWLDRAYLSGAIDLPADYVDDPEPYAAVKWVPQGWPYINPVQDIQAQKDAVRSGLDSRSNLVSEQGEDAEAIDAQQAADNTRADDLGLRYDSDGRQALNPKASSDPSTPPDPSTGDPTPPQASTFAPTITVTTPDVHVAAPVVTVSPPAVTIAEGAIHVTMQAAPKSGTTRKRVERDARQNIIAIVEESVLATVEDPGRTETA